MVYVELENGVEDVENLLYDFLGPKMQVDDEFNTAPTWDNINAKAPMIENAGVRAVDFGEVLENMRT
jgi:hypothetical protein